jgi:SAM-dependent methyltransferase
LKIFRTTSFSMKKEHVIRSVPEARWREAQEFELQFAEHAIIQNDDWNLWWRDKFDGYRLLHGKTFENVLEVGCGPHTNIRCILPHVTCRRIFLEDPLIHFYLTRYLKSKRFLLHALLGMKWKAPKPNYLVRLTTDRRYRTDISAAMLEDLPYRDGLMDLVVCINVLDHVQSFDQCMEEMHRVLRTGGILVLGQDLSNEEDLEMCPESYADVGHPIKVDEESIDSWADGRYSPLLRRVLAREEGRNPPAHYGTYIGLLQKI